MNREGKRLIEYLGQLLQAIERIDSYTAGLDPAWASSFW